MKEYNEMTKQTNLEVCGPAVPPPPVVALKFDGLLGHGWLEIFENIL